jgi:hypothetical protein
VSIESRAQDRRFERGCEIDMRALGYRMYTGVRPSSSMHAGFFPGYPSESCL